MKKSLLAFSSLLLVGGLSCVVAGDSPAIPSALVTLTVTHFTPITDYRYVDAATSLADHPVVQLGNDGGMAKLTVQQAVDLEIAVASADPAESYTPLAIYFVQRQANGGDPDGAKNFAVTDSDHGRLIVQDKFLTTGSDGQYEFFVVVQRASDGAIGVIDPDIGNDTLP